MLTRRDFLAAGTAVERVIVERDDTEEEAAAFRDGAAKG